MKKLLDLSMPWYKERFAMNALHKWYFSVCETELEELHLKFYCEKVCEQLS
jgi:hypothetical protein